MIQFLFSNYKSDSFSFITLLQRMQKNRVNIINQYKPNTREQVFWFLPFQSFLPRCIFTNAFKIFLSPPPPLL